MRKLMIVAVLLTLILTMAAPAWADGPGIEVITAWGAANTTGLTVAFVRGGRGATFVTGWIPEADTGKLDSIAAIEDVYKVNPQGVESALGTFSNDTPVAYSSGPIAYMARVGFNPAVVGGPNIPPGSVTPAMMPNGYLLIDQIGPGGWAVQLNPGETPAALAGAVSAPAPQTVSKSTPAPAYTKPQPSDVQTKATPQEVATTSPSVPAPGEGSAAPVKLTPAQQQAAAQHVRESYITNPPVVHVPKPASVAKPFPWKWVYIGGGALVLVAVTVLKVLRKNRNTDFRCLSVKREV